MALAAVVVWGFAITSLVLPLLLLLCSFFHREKKKFSSLKMKENPGVDGMVKLSRLDYSDGRAALPGGTSSPAGPWQQADGPVVPGDSDNPAVEDPGLHRPGHTPHSQALSGPASRTPEFLRHRQLPVLPGDASTPVVDSVQDAEGRIYESIRYKSRTLRNPLDAGSTPGDSPSLPTKDKPSIPTLEDIALVELASEGSPGPVYAQVCKMPRSPQQPTSLSEPEEEAPPALPEKRFDVV
ncbi:uncharacterized protein LOC128851892 [Cuculus canorus]|uniref:uncharacterized protein LOC128851892 n=1 Tax=Cuculus canorus TaxID=55661 RepID=UPI0023AAD915|nr:uncharacterized protein LOC128851892 [Cuculus canorus]